MSSMGLSTKAVSAVQKMTKKASSHGNPCGNCTKRHTPGREHCPAKDSTCHSCQKIGHWKQKCRKSNKAKDSHKKPKSQPQRWHGRRRADEVGVSEGDPAFSALLLPCRRGFTSSHFLQHFWKGNIRIYANLVG